MPSVTAKIWTRHVALHPLETFTGDSIGTSYVTYTHAFSGGSAGDTGAGLVFNGTLDYYTEVCFDDVTLVKN